MRNLVFIALFLTLGCSSKKTGMDGRDYFRPSELITMAGGELPTDPINVHGQLYYFDSAKSIERDQVSFMIEDIGIRTVDDKKVLLVVFSSKDKEFSESFINWVKTRRTGEAVALKGKVIRKDKDTFLHDCEVAH